MPKLNEKYLCAHQNYCHYEGKLKEPVLKTRTESSLIIHIGLNKDNCTPAITINHTMLRITEVRRANKQRRI